MAELEMDKMTRMQVRKIRQKKLKHKIIFTGMATALVLILCLFFLIGTKLFTSFTPDIVMANFTKNMQTGNYQAAYRFLNSNGPMLTEKTFVEAQKNLGAIKEMSYKTAEKGKYQLKVVRGSNIKNYSIAAINSGSWIFTDWRIDVVPFTDEINILTKTKGAVLKAGNIYLGTSNGQKPITYRAFAGYRHTAVMQLEGAQNLIFEMPANLNAQAGYMITTDEFKNSLANLIQQYDSELSKTYVDWNMDRLQPFLKPDEEGYKWVSDTVSKIKASGVPLNKRLLLFSTGNAYLEDRTHAVIEVGEIWSDTQKPIKLNYRLEKINNSWKIVTAVAAS